MFAETKAKDMKKDILKFIEGFDDPVMIKHFTEGYCFYFACILKAYCDYWGHPSVIMYNPVLNHFSICTGMHYYDITGEVSGSGYTPWWDYEKVDHLDRQRVVKYCILKED